MCIHLRPVDFNGRYRQPFAKIQGTLLQDKRCGGTPTAAEQGSALAGAGQLAFALNHLFWLNLLGFLGSK